VSQPFDAQIQTPALREIDEDHGEFWVPSPWLFPSSGENLSAYERNGIHLNAGDGVFFNISALTGADSTGDGRSVISFDITDDGMPELLVRQAGGGPLLVFENRFPASSWLRISLRGIRSNSLGIGSKIECEVDGKTLYRELYPGISFLSQSPASVHFGLGNAATISRLAIRWPSGEKQVFTDVPVNSHIQITESDSKIRTIIPGEGVQE
jgi:enediyne biosynthesis protein E4